MPELFEPTAIDPVVDFLAGLTLRERWSNWNRGRFTSDSTQHVSVWEKHVGG